MDLGRPVGVAHPPFIIAALDCRELGTLERSLAAVDAAADSRVDAIKLVRMPWAWTAKLIARAEARNLTLLAPALDEDAITRLDWLGASAFYLVFDWSDLDLVASAARTGKPLVMQVGTASEVELAEVVATVHANGTRRHRARAVGDRRRSRRSRLAARAWLGRRHRRSLGGSRDSRRPRSRAARASSRRGSRCRPTGQLLCPVEVSAVVRGCEQAWASLGDDRRWTLN